MARKDQGGDAQHDAAARSATRPAQPHPEEGEAPTGTPHWRINLAKRVATGLPVFAAVLALIALAPLILQTLVVGAAGVYGMYEYIRMQELGHGTRLPMIPLLVAAGLIGLGGMLGSASALNAGLFAAAMLALWFSWFQEQADGEDAQRQAGLALAGLVLVPWLLTHAALLLSLPAGRGFLAFVVVTVTLNDTLAYLVGTLAGRRLLLPAISPRKTVEGALGGLAGGVIGGLIAQAWVEGFSPWSLLLLGGLLAVVAQAGDLLESKLKRLNNAVQSGHCLPGHGGLLDRLDAYLLAAPVAYYLLLWTG